MDLTFERDLTAKTGPVETPPDFAALVALLSVHQAKSPIARLAAELDRDDDCAIPERERLIEIFAPRPRASRAAGALQGAFNPRVPASAIAATGGKPW